MKAAGYDLHHSTEDGKFLIMGNGTRAFAVTVEPVQEKDNPLPTFFLQNTEEMVDFRTLLQTPNGSTAFTVRPWAALPFFFVIVIGLDQQSPCQKISAHSPQRIKYGTCDSDKCFFHFSLHRQPLLVT